MFKGDLAVHCPSVCDSVMRVKLCRGSRSLGAAGANVRKAREQESNLRTDATF